MRGRRANVRHRRKRAHLLIRAASVVVVAPVEIDAVSPAVGRSIGGSQLDTGAIPLSGALIRILAIPVCSLDVATLPVDPALEISRPRSDFR